LTKELITI